MDERLADRAAKAETAKREEEARLIAREEQMQRCEEFTMTLKQNITRPLILQIIDTGRIRKESGADLRVKSHEHDVDRQRSDPAVIAHIRPLKVMLCAPEAISSEPEDSSDSLMYFCCAQLLRL